MTKVIILGQEEKQQTKKPIEFVYSMVRAEGGGIILEKEQKSDIKPNEWSCIELICLNYLDRLDMMYAHDGEEGREGCLYLGHFNDGVVE